MIRKAIREGREGANDCKDGAATLTHGARDGDRALVCAGHLLILGAVFNNEMRVRRWGTRHEAGALGRAVRVEA